MYIKEGKGKLALFLHCKQCFTYPLLFIFYFRSPPQSYYFPSSIFLFPIFPSSSSFSSFLLFSLHHRHIPIFFLPPPPPPPHFYCFPSTTTTTTATFPFSLLLLLIFIVFPPPPPPHFYCFPSNFGLLGRLGLILASLTFRGKTIEMRRRRKNNKNEEEDGKQ